MRTKKIKTDIINNRVKEHKKYKLQLLKLIDEMPNVSQGGVSKSDWSLPKDHPRKYLDLFYMTSGRKQSLKKVVEQYGIEPKLIKKLKLEE